MESGGAGDEEGVIRGGGGCLVQPGSDTSPPRGQPPGALNAGGDVRRGRGQSAALPPPPRLASCTHRGTQAAPVPSLLEAGAPAAGGAVRMRVQTACVPWCQAPCACADGVCRRRVCLRVRPRVRVLCGPQPRGAAEDAADSRQRAPPGRAASTPHTSGGWAPPRRWDRAVGRVFQAQGTPRVMVRSRGQVVVGESSEAGHRPLGVGRRHGPEPGRISTREGPGPSAARPFPLRVTTMVSPYGCLARTRGALQPGPRDWRLRHSWPRSGAQGPSPDCASVPRPRQPQAVLPRALPGHVPLAGSANSPRVTPFCPASSLRTTCCS